MGWFEDAHKTMVENLQTFNLQTHLDKYPVGSDIYPVVPILVDRGVEWVGLKMPTKQWSKIFKPSGKPPECHLSIFAQGSPGPGVEISRALRSDLLATPWPTWH